MPYHRRTSGDDGWRQQKKSGKIERRRDEKDEMRAHIDDQLQRLQDITHMLEPGAKYTISKVSIGLNRIFRRVQVAEQSPEDKTGIASDTTH